METNEVELFSGQVVRVGEIRHWNDTSRRSYEVIVDRTSIGSFTDPQIANFFARLFEDLSAPGVGRPLEFCLDALRDLAECRVFLAALVQRELQVQGKIDDAMRRSIMRLSGGRGAVG